MKINSINVVEYTDNTIHSIATFINNPLGNFEAEQDFKQKAMRCGMKETESNNCIQDGIFETENYQIFLIYSC